MSPNSAKQGENLRKLRNSPVCIICGRPGEAEAIAEALGIVENRLSSHEVAEMHNDHTFYLGSFTLKDGYQLDYVLTSSTRQGVQSFTVQATLLVHILRPRFLLHAGICAGNKSAKVGLGHVVFGESAVNFEEGKFQVAEGGKVVFAPDYRTYSVHTGDMQAFAEHSSRPTYHYGDYITGSAVREDASVIFNKISSQIGRNVIALDMEASAFLELCNYFNKDTKCLGVVKGVSDLGDEHKGDNSSAKGIALINTAEALRAWIFNSIKTKSWEDDYSKEPAAELLPGYYDNFIQWVLNNVAQGLPVTRKHVTGQVHHLAPILKSQIKGFKTIMPKGNDPRQYEGLGPITSICDKYDIVGVEVGGEHAKRSLYYKAGYLIDWPRTLNRFSGTSDAKHQVKVFGELLKRKGWFHDSSNNLRAEVVSWEDFEQWLAELPAAEPTPILYHEPEETKTIATVTTVERDPSPPAGTGKKWKSWPFNSKVASLGRQKNSSGTSVATH